MKVNVSHSMIIFGLGVGVFFVTTLEGGAPSPCFEVGSLWRIRDSVETGIDIGQTVLEYSHLRSLSWFAGDPAEALLVYGSTDRFATLVPVPPGDEANSLQFWRVVVYLSRLVHDAGGCPI
jgi:hypothetical protein